MSIKFLVLGGGEFGFGGGGSTNFIFMGARIFLIRRCLEETRPVAEYDPIRRAL